MQWYAVVQLYNIYSINSKSSIICPKNEMFPEFGEIKLG